MRVEVAAGRVVSAIQRLQHLVWEEREVQVSLRQFPDRLVAMRAEEEEMEPPIGGLATTGAGMAGTEAIRHRMVLPIRVEGAAPVIPDQGFPGRAAAALSF
jgi:hypothetical protein